MQKKAVIQVIGKQKYLEGHDDQQELTTVGSFYERNGAFYVIYKESEVTGLEGATTTLSIKEDVVVLNRMGTVELKQEFKEGVLYRSIYVTPFGKLWLSVMPQRVEIDLTAHGGRISLEYDLFVDDNLVSHNVLMLNIKEDLPR